MVKILYAINGEGMGHAIRSIAIIDELKKKHDIQIIAGSKRCFDVLNKKYSNVHLINGLKIIYEKNTVSNIKTFKNYFNSIFKNSGKNFKKIYKVIKKFKPDIIISDFEIHTFAVTSLSKIPVICLCNIHALTEMKYKVPKQYKKDYFKSKMVVELLSPGVDYHLITSFFKLPLRKHDRKIFPPVLREKIFKTKPALGEHILVYQTSKTNKKLIGALRKIDKKPIKKFIIYGFDKSSEEKNLQFKKFNEDEFIKDLKECYACISNGGFTVLTEAIHLNKPVLSIPVEGQFEQILNAMQIQRMGYGEFHDKANKQIIENFISKQPIYYKNLKNSEKHHDNSKIINYIENIIKKEGRLKREKI